MTMAAMAHVQDCERLRQRPSLVTIGFWGILLFILASAECLSATHYVVTNGTPGWIGAADPYTNWATAGTNIIDVVNTAATNNSARLVLVSNGVYYLTNVINVTNSMTLQSINGRGVTILAGQGSLTTNRCASFSATGSVFNGFAITNFYVTSQGGAVYSSTGGISIINCLFVGNSNIYTNTISGSGCGGGVYVNTTGYAGIITNCIFSNNYAFVNGGGLTLSHGAGVQDAKVEGCYFYGNLCDDLYGGGGGACYISGYRCIISNCIAINNTHYTGGGAFAIAGGSDNKILNCSIMSNNVILGKYGGGGGGGIRASSSGLLVKDCSIIGNWSATTGGAVWASSSAIIRNCLIAQNKATGTYAQIGGGVWLTNSTIENCTIVSNYAGVSGGGLYIDGSGSGTNNIVYFNMAGTSANNFTNTAGNTGLQYSCVIPAVDGTRNITNDPSLVNLDGGDYRLNGNSPCVNAGLNQSWMTNAVDRDGRQRIRYGTVDMGAYEVICGGTIYGFH